MDGSLRTMPRPLAKMQVLAVPRSMATSLENAENRFMGPRWHSGGMNRSFTSEHRSAFHLTKMRAIFAVAAHRGCAALTKSTRFYKSVIREYTRGIGGRRHPRPQASARRLLGHRDRKSTRLNSS